MPAESLMFNPAPGWPRPPEGWSPPPGWSPDPSWPAPPPGWQLWTTADRDPGASPAQQAGEALPNTPTKTASLRDDLSARISYLEAENALLRSQLTDAAPNAPIELDDARALQDVGIYRYHHPLESAAAYKGPLESLHSRIGNMVRSGHAIAASELFTFNNSLAQGRRLSRDLAKLMLRAYNAEAENVIRTLRAGNVNAAKRRLDSSRSAIARLGSLMEMHIDEQFHALRVEEIELTADWLMKKQQEREEAREERARLREEQRVRRELEEERARLDKERAHLVNALGALQQQGLDDAELRRRLADVDAAIDQNDFRAANIRAGYIYVISNEGAFGRGVVKIGLTRRLDPRDRITELSGASVPFRFDVHTLFFSEDAVGLENALHKTFAARALNQTNARKEFFFATPREVRSALLEHVGSVLEFSENADAEEYRQSLRYWPENERFRADRVLLGQDADSF